VMIVDRADFPRDKVCAGWITPQVLADLQLDADAYRTRHTFQPIVGFRVGTIGRSGGVTVRYSRPVSFGIRRCEFDHHLLQRACARVRSGHPVTSIRRERGRWIVNDSIEAAALVGAGGHFCPVARWLNGPIAPHPGVPLVAAQEVEFELPPESAAAFTTEPELPELYFCADLQGYGWVFRKERHVNVGFGRIDRHAVPAATADFVRFLAARGIVPADTAWRWRGHAYRVWSGPPVRVADDGVLLAGDAAGLAYPRSGEGIRPAIESGLLAAETLIEARGSYVRSRLEPYARRLRDRFGASGFPHVAAGTLPARLTAALGVAALGFPSFVRHVVLDRWFLRASEAPLASR
jgi:flavin-dependent dehydrogenase